MHWIFQESEAHLKHQDDLVVVSWIHSHVRGAKCFFSSIDVHSQYSYELFHDVILGGVFEIDIHNNCPNFDFYRLTPEGKEIVGACSKNKNLPGTFHETCQIPSFYRSQLSQISYVTSIPTRLFNFSSIQPVIDEFNQQNDARCDACFKRMPRKTLLKHIALKKLCKSFYAEQYQEMSTQSRKNTNSEYKKKNAQNIKRKKELYDFEHREEQREKKQKYNEEHKEEIRLKAKERRENSTLESRLKSFRDEIMPVSYTHLTLPTIYSV